MDAVDAALVSFADSRAELVAYQEFPIDDHLKTAIRDLDSSSSIAECTKYDVLMGHLFADAVLEILTITRVQADQVAAIGSHGQTILHLPDQAQPTSLQIGDPNIIANKTGITTVADFRRMDIADGGQGAPLAPAFHQSVFRKPTVNRLILNLGGIANISLLPGDGQKNIAGFDTGPANGLLDDWNQLHCNTAMDRDSIWASSGQANSALLKLLLSDPYFDQLPPKSTGRDYFNLAWLQRYLHRLGKDLLPEDVQATLLELSLTTVADAINQHSPETTEIYLCGGGAHNPVLVKKLGKSLPNIEMYSTWELGLNPDAIEAITFAWLARKTLASQAGNQPEVTGAKQPQVLGGLYQPLSSSR